LRADAGLALAGRAAAATARAVSRQASSAARTAPGLILTDPPYPGNQAERAWSTRT